MTAQQLRSALARLTGAADRDMAALWRQISTAAQARQALGDVLPALVEQYGAAAAALAAEWYDDLRVKQGVRGSFRAIPVDLGTAGAEALAGFGAQSVATNQGAVDAAKVLVAGGLQRRIADYARGTIAGSSVADPQASGWQRETSGGCAFCEMLAGRGDVYSEATADFASHDNCFPAGVLVTGPSVEIGYRRWYKGELVIVRVAGGKELPVTPNHPVLTPQGWVAAGLLREGDEVIERAGADLASLQVPHEQDVPTPIEDVWGSPRMDLLRSVPVFPQHFHGDHGVRQGDVDVVAANGFLAGVLAADRVQEAAERVCAGAGPASIANALSTGRDGLLPFVRAFTFADGRMSCGGQRPALVGRQGQHADGPGFGGGAHAQSRIAQPTRYYGTGHPVPPGHREDALATGVDRAEVGRRIEPVVGGTANLRTRYYSAPMERDPDSIGASATHSGRDLIERLTGGVQPLRVVELVRRETSGHVFNLQTAEGWYEANGIVVSNCQCTAVPAFDGLPRPVKPYTPSRRKVTDADRARVREYLRTH